MNTIRTITESDLGRIAYPDTWTIFEDRTAARAIMINEDFHIALMHVANKDYFKLPGGGVDLGESLETALRRELKEETGADSVEIIREVGNIIEYRERWQRRGVHTCYFVKLKGKLSNPQRTQKEIDQGYEVIWANTIDQAIALVRSGKPKDYGQDFEQLREVSFLEYVRDNNFINNISL